MDGQSPHYIVARAGPSSSDNYILSPNSDKENSRRRSSWWKYLNVTHAARRSMFSEGRPPLLSQSKDMSNLGYISAYDDIIERNSIDVAELSLEENRVERITSYSDIYDGRNVDRQSVHTEYENSSLDDTKAKKRNMFGKKLQKRYDISSAFLPNDTEIQLHQSERGDESLHVVEASRIQKNIFQRKDSKKRKYSTALSDTAIVSRSHKTSLENQSRLSEVKSVRQSRHHDSYEALAAAEAPHFQGNNLFQRKATVRRTLSLSVSDASTQRNLSNTSDNVSEEIAPQNAIHVTREKIRDIEEQNLSRHKSKDSFTNSTFHSFDNLLSSTKIHPNKNSPELRKRASLYQRYSSSNLPSKHSEYYVVPNENVENENIGSENAINKSPNQVPDNAQRSPTTIIGASPSCTPQKDVLHNSKPAQEILEDWSDESSKHSHHAKLPTRGSNIPQDTNSETEQDAHFQETYSNRRFQIDHSSQENRIPLTNERTLLQSQFQNNREVQNASVSSIADTQETNISKRAYEADNAQNVEVYHRSESRSSKMSGRVSEKNQTSESRRPPKRTSEMPSDSEADYPPAGYQNPKMSESRSSKMSARESERNHRQRSEGNQHSNRVSDIPSNSEEDNPPAGYPNPKISKSRSSKMSVRENERRYRQRSGENQPSNTVYDMPSDSETDNPPTSYRNSKISVSRSSKMSTRESERHYTQRSEVKQQASRVYDMSSESEVDNPPTGYRNSKMSQSRSSKMSVRESEKHYRQRSEVNQPINRVSNMPSGSETDNPPASYQNPKMSESRSSTMSARETETHYRQRSGTNQPINRVSDVPTNLEADSPPASFLNPKMSETRSSKMSARESVRHSRQRSGTNQSSKRTSDLPSDSEDDNPPAGYRNPKMSESRSSKISAKESERHYRQISEANQPINRISNMSSDSEVDNRPSSYRNPKMSESRSSKMSSRESERHYRQRSEANLPSNRESYMPSESADNPPTDYRNLKMSESRSSKMFDRESDRHYRQRSGTNQPSNTVSDMPSDSEADSPPASYRNSKMSVSRSSKMSTRESERHYRQRSEVNQPINRISNMLSDSEADIPPADYRNPEISESRLSRMSTRKSQKNYRQKSGTSWSSNRASNIPSDSEADSQTDSRNPDMSQSRLSKMSARESQKIYRKTSASRPSNRLSDIPSDSEASEDEVIIKKQKISKDNHLSLKENIPRKYPNDEEISLDQRKISSKVYNETKRNIQEMSISEESDIETESLASKKYNETKRGTTEMSISDVSNIVKKSISLKKKSRYTENVSSQEMEMDTPHPTKTRKNKTTLLSSEMSIDQSNHEVVGKSIGRNNFTIRNVESMSLEETGMELDTTLNKNNNKENVSLNKEELQLSSRKKSIRKYSNAENVTDNSIKATARKSQQHRNTHTENTDIDEIQVNDASEMNNNKLLKSVKKSRNRVTSNIKYDDILEMNEAENSNYSAITEENTQNITESNKKEMKTHEPPESPALGRNKKLKIRKTAVKDSSDILDPDESKSKNTSNNSRKRTTSNTRNEEPKNRSLSNISEANLENSATLESTAIDRKKSLRSTSTVLKDSPVKKSNSDALSSETHKRKTRKNISNVLDNSRNRTTSRTDHYDMEIHEPENDDQQNISEANIEYSAEQTNRVSESLIHDRKKSLQATSTVLKDYPSKKSNSDNLPSEEHKEKTRKKSSKILDNSENRTTSRAEYDNNMEIHESENDDQQNISEANIENSAEQTNRASESLIHDRKKSLRATSTVLKDSPSKKSNSDNLSSEEHKEKTRKKSSKINSQNRTTSQAEYDNNMEIHESEEDSQNISEANLENVTESENITTRTDKTSETPTFDRKKSLRVTRSLLKASPKSLRTLRSDTSNNSQKYITVSSENIDTSRISVANKTAASSAIGRKDRSKSKRSILSKTSNLDDIPSEDHISDTNQSVNIKKTNKDEIQMKESEADQSVLLKKKSLKAGKTNVDEFSHLKDGMKYKNIQNVDADLSEYFTNLNSKSKLKAQSDEESEAEDLEAMVNLIKTSSPPAPKLKMRRIDELFPKIPKSVALKPAPAKKKEIPKWLLLPDGKPVPKPKLYKSQKWMTNKFYKHLEKILEPKYHTKNTLKAEEIMKALGETTRIVNKSNKYMKNEVESLKMVLAREGVIETTFEFFDFLTNWLPLNLCYKMVPIGRAKLEFTRSDRFIVPYDRETVFQKIIQP